MKFIVLLGFTASAVFGEQLFSDGDTIPVLITDLLSPLDDTTRSLNVTFSALDRSVTRPPIKGTTIGTATSLGGHYSSSHALMSTIYEIKAMRDESCKLVRSDNIDSRLAEYLRTVAHDGYNVHIEVGGKGAVTAGDNAWGRIAGRYYNVFPWSYLDFMPFSPIDSSYVLNNHLSFEIRYRPGKTPSMNRIVDVIVTPASYRGDRCTGRKVLVDPQANYQGPGAKNGAVQYTYSVSWKMATSDSSEIKVSPLPRIEPVASSGTGYSWVYGGALSSATGVLVCLAASATLLKVLSGVPIARQLVGRIASIFSGRSSERAE